MPFRYEIYDDRGGGNIGALMMAPAQARARALREAAMAQARAAEVRGANTANAIGSIGQIIQGGIQGYQQEKADAPRREMEALQLRAARGQMQGAEVEAAREQRREAAFTDLLSRGTMPDPREILTIYGPERGSKIADGLQAFASLQTKQVTDARDTAGRLAIGFKQFSPQLQAQFWPAIRQAAITGGLGDAQTIPEQPTPDLLDGVIAWAKGEQPKQEGFTLSPGQTRFGPDGKPLANVAPEAPKPPPVGSFEDFVVQKYGERPTPQQIAQGRRDYGEAGRAPVINVTTGGGTAAGDVAAPADPMSQDLMSQAGLSYNGFLALTGRMSQLPRDRDTRNRASAEVAKWARERGMDVSTLASQYKAYNEALENNIARYNRTLLAEGEIAASVTNLKQAAQDSGLGDARAINAAKQWVRGELNDPDAAQYAFFLNQLVNDIALYNAASQGRAALQADMEDAKSVVQRGISSGSLTGMERAIKQSVEKMGTVLEGAVNRSRRNVWELFGVGEKYKPTTKPREDGGAGRTGGPGGTPSYQDYLRRRGGGQ